MDLFSVTKDTYIVIVDNLTKYWDIEELTETTAENTVLQTKKIFSRHGVPEFVISDNGPQFTSSEYKKFSEEWNFQHHTSSPYYPRGNGTAEAEVKQAKRILKLSKDPWLAILEM
jgi:transposase InsO family protein